MHNELEGVTGMNELISGKCTCLMAVDYRFQSPTLANIQALAWCCKGKPISESDDSWPGIVSIRYFTCVGPMSFNFRGEKCAFSPRSMRPMADLADKTSRANGIQFGYGVSARAGQWKSR